MLYFTWNNHKPSSILPLLILLLMLAGCVAQPITDREPSPASAPVTGQTQPGDALIPLRMSVSPFITYSAFYIALEEGFFEEVGLAIEPIFFERPSNAIPALAQREIDVMGGNISSAMLNTMARDANIRLVTTTAQNRVDECVLSGILLRTGTAIDEADTISAEILRTLRYHVLSGGPSTIALERWLAEYGVTLDEITFIDFPSASAWFGPLQEGTVDVVSASEPWLTRATAAGFAKLWWAHKDVVPNSEISGIVFGPSILEDNPELGERFMVAFRRGVKQLQEGKTERNLEIMEKHLQLDRELLAQVCLPSIAPDGMVNVASVEAFTQWATEHDFMDRPMQAEEFWDPRFIEYANRMVGEE